MCLSNQPSCSLTRLLLLDFAEYTSAKTRIALGKKARKAETTKLRKEMQELIADAFVSLLHPIFDFLLIHVRDEIDEETQEWEQAQIKRSGMKLDEASSPSATPVYKPTPSMRVHESGLRVHSHVEF